MDSRAGWGRPLDPADDSWAPLRDDSETTDPAHPWAWAAQEPDAERRLDTSTAQVTAVLVAFDAARWLPATLDALSRQTRRPDRLIAVDNGSSDTTKVLLERARDAGLIDAVYAGERGDGFGAAVQAALRRDRPEGGRRRRTGHPDPVEHGSNTEPGPSVPDGEDPGFETHWLWLLHDDAEPAPDALYRLLAHVLTDPTVDITGPKLLLPRRRFGGHPISEVGVSISGTGRRELYLDAGEIDQGQRDQPRARLGVSTCGMLVRRSVWHDLDGLDPALPVFRDGVEFGWRAHLNGYRVVTTPRAEMIHRQVGHAGLRIGGHGGRHPGAVDRQLGMLVVAGHAPRAVLPLVWLRLVWSCLVRAAGYLVGKVPSRSRDELVALVGFVGHPGRIRDVRRRTTGIDPAPGTGDVVRALRPPWWSGLRVGAEVVSGVATERYRAVAGDVDVATLDELTGDDFASQADETPKSPWLRPIVLTTLIMVLGSAIAARLLWASGSLVSDVLLPAPDTLAAAWRTAIAPIPGAPDQIPPPWLALVALGSTLTLGRADLLLTIVLCGVVPLSLVAVYPLVRRLVHGPRLRIWVAVSYALLPVLLGATNQGRLALALTAIALPLLLLAVWALVLRRVRAPEGWRGGWGAAVVLTVLVAFEPSLFLLALVLGGLGAVALRRTPRKIGRIGIALGVPFLVWLPWLPSLIAAPGRFLVGPDAALEGTPAAPAAWRLMLGDGLGAGQPPLWLTVPVFAIAWSAALVGLANRPERRIVRAAWVTALMAFAFAVVLSRQVVAVPPVGVQARPWVGGYLLIGFAALLIAAGVGLDGLTAHLRERSFSWLQPGAAVAAVLVLVVTAAAAGWWVVAGATGPIARARLDALPPYVLNAMRGPAQPRVMAIDLAGGGARYAILGGGQQRLGDADRGGTFGGSRQARAMAEDLVVRIVAGTGDADIAPQLRDLGIGFLFVVGADGDVAARIDNTPELGAASGTEQGTVWQLQPPTSRSAVAQDGQLVPAGRPPVALPPGGDGRELRIGEPADRRWRADIDGTAVQPLPGSWQQVYPVASAGGTAHYALRSPAPWLLILQAALLLVAVVLAAPAIRQPEVRDPTKSARRSATLSELG